MGAISQAQGRLPQWLGPVYGQIGCWLRQQRQAHADETTHYHHGARYWLWTLCNEQAAYFLLHPSHGKLAARQLLGEFRGVLITDRYAAYNDHAGRQLCWAHVIRNLQGIARRRGEAGQIGQRLLRLARRVIRVVHHYQRGLLSDAGYRQRLIHLRRAFQAQLRRGSQCAHPPRTQRQCQALLKEEALLWTFVRYPGVALTNNLAERTLRGYVIWRKTRFFTQSIRGLSFRPMMLSVVISAQRLGLNPYPLLRKICGQGLRGEPVDVRLPLPQQLLPAPP